jgi:hypothetical protein
VINTNAGSRSTVTQTHLDAIGCTSNTAGSTAVLSGLPGIIDGKYLCDKAISPDGTTDYAWVRSEGVSEVAVPVPEHTNFFTQQIHMSVSAYIFCILLALASWSITGWLIKKGTDK